eukprot:m.13339 g.13339  ORF g.13339 m.13339 type:complete len:117 (-) comp5933_c0_seq1:334-684(-)
MVLFVTPFLYFRTLHLTVQLVRWVCIFAECFDCECISTRATTMSSELFAQEIEAEAMSDLFSKLIKGCQSKCLTTKYTEKELAKGEAVCLDRCVAKFLEVHDLIGKSMNMQPQTPQ